MRVRSILLVMSLVTIAVSLPGCLEEGEGDLIFVDGLGTEVRLDGTPRTVITLTPALTEIVFLLDCGDRLVGTDSDSNYPPEASGIEHVSSWQGLDTERVVALDPDIIFMDHTLDASGDRYGTLTGLGLVVYRIYPRDIEGLMDVIMDIGDVLDVPQKAREQVELLEDRIEEVNMAADGDPSPAPTVLHVVYYDGTSDPWVMTDSTFSGDMIARAGGACAVTDSTGLSVQVGLERIIQADPDIIICSQSTLWPTKSRQLILEDARLSTLSAVEAERVHDIDGDLIDRTGPRLIDGLESIRGLVEDYHTEG